MISRTRIVIPAFVLFVLSAMVNACGGGTGTGDEGRNDTSDISGVDTATGDLPSDTDSGLPLDVNDLNGSDESLSDLYDAFDAMQDSDVEQGGPGWPCASSSDCNSGFCLDTPAGRECTDFCASSESCPRGYACQAVESSSDSVFVCVHTMPKICTPCIDDSDCASTQTDSFSACVGDNSGKFCAGECSIDENCPRGYVCRLVSSAAGSSTRQCVPENGVCTCSKRAIESAAATLCVKENLAGRCSGEIVCTEDGLTPCSAIEPAAEECNNVDDDCNGTTDDVTTRACLVKNVFGSCPGTTVCNSGNETCQGPQPAQETCNGIDDNCNGQTDEENSSGCSARYMDFDSDSYGDSADMKCLCGPSGKYTASRGNDCNDGNADIKPGVTESCNGVDDNCNGQTDEEGASSCRNYYYDQDRDSYGTTATPKCLCVATNPWSALRTGDCNDSDSAINPGMTETCNGKDDNCDGNTDPIDSDSCTPFYYDGDSDSYGSSGVSPRCQCGPDYVTRFKVQAGGDCNDLNLTINPAAREKCDSIDNNCDGTTDEPGAQGCITRYADHDGDGFGYGQPVCSCTEEAPYTAESAGDCNDNDFFVNPNATESCGDSIDNDCNGKTDEENGDGCETWFYDGDRDTYGDSTRTRCLCGASQSTKYDASNGSDCNDANPSINPGMRESCGNSIDDNCNASTDEENAVSCVFFYYDNDGDGFGVTTVKKCLCTAQDLYRASVGGDCDDSTQSTNPSRTETCAAGDQNCNGTDNEENASGCIPHYYDGDADSFGRDDLPTRCLCAADIASGYRASAGGDCNDADSTINPGRIEVCEPDGTTAVDNNCNSFLNEENAIGCKPYFYDGDRDGHGVTGGTSKCYCTGGNVGLRYTSLLQDDCNDSDPAVAGGFPELCDNKDNNCNGSTDENGASDCTTYYYDGDRDGFGQTSLTQCRCFPDIATGYDTTLPDDCNDTNSSVYPGQSVCGVDGSCDGNLLDPLEQCDDGNGTSWDGCTSCVVSEVKINTYVNDDQNWPSVALKSDGAWAVAYSSVRVTTGEDIAVRTLNSAGIPTGTETFISSYNTGVQTKPDIAAISDGLVVVWESAGVDGDNFGVSARILNNDGSARYPEFLVNGTSGNLQGRPAVAVGPSDKIVTVWQSNLQDGSYDGIYGRIHVAPGTAFTSETVIPQTTAGAQTNPDVAIWAAGERIVVTWTGEYTVGSSTDTRVFFRVFDMDFTPVTNEIMVTGSGSTIAGQDNSSVASLGTAGFVVAFEDSSVDGNDKGIRYRAFDWSGNPLTTPQMANTTTTGMQASPSVAAFDTSSFVIGWWSIYQDPDGSGAAVARKFTIGGTPGNEQILNVYQPSFQWYTSVATSGSTFMAVWMSSIQDSSGSGIFGRLF